MKKIILIGRTGTGKTTLTQALKGREITYHKTQYVNHYDVIIDTPGEYCENRGLANGIILYAYEADIVGLMMSSTEDYSVYSPNTVSLATREVIGIVTKINEPGARTDMAENWLKLTGCKTIFFIDSVTGEGVADILRYLSEKGDVLPWETETIDENCRFEDGHLTIEDGIRLVNRPIVKRF